MLAQSHRFFKILILAGLIFILTFLVIGNLKINQKRQNLNLKVETIRNKIQEFYQEKESLKSKISQAETKGYLEKFAREEFNLQAIGEKVVAFIEERQEQENSQRTQTFFENLKENLKKLFRLK